MHVLIISLDSGLFSGKDAYRNRLKEYGKHVERISVVVYTPSRNLQPLKISKNVVAYPSNSISKLTFPNDCVKLASNIHKKRKISVIDTQDVQSTGLAGLIIKKKFNIPLQVQLHGDYVNNKWWVNSASRHVLNRLSLFVLKRADNVRVVSKRVEKHISTIVSKSKITRYPIFTDLKKFESCKPAKVKGNPVFLFVGRLSEEKNVKLLIRAFSGIFREFSKAKLVILGDGSEKKSLISLAKKLKIDKHVEFVGFTDPIPYYKAATCLVLPSLHEGWALVAIEAAASGCPVIMSDVGCAGEIIINNKSGLVFPVNDEKKLVEVMKMISKNNKLRTRLASEAEKIVKRLPSESETIKKMTDSWEKTAGKK